MKQTILETEKAITLVKQTFEKSLSTHLNLVKVFSPLFVLDGTGINDDLNGVERPVKFAIKSLEDRKGVIVHSLAKWKRLRLKQLGVLEGEGIITDMRALRPDEDYSPIHSIYVDQWDWELHIDKKDRNLETLKNTVRKIYQAIKETEREVIRSIKQVTHSVLPNEITFIHAEELYKKHPTLTAKERENIIAKEHKAVFIIGIGGALSNGISHDGRAADYDDWSSRNEDGLNGLNGDIIVWNPIINSAFELSSMGIRVDKDALLNQLELRDCIEKQTLYFHNLVITNEIPQSIGGGIGQSRLCMYLLNKHHIGEVQVGLWPEEEVSKLNLEKIQLM